jgi:hypothetical protein
MIAQTPSGLQQESIGRGGHLATDSLKNHPGPPCLTLLRPASGPPPPGVAHRVGGLRPSSTPIDTPRRMGLVYSRVYTPCQFRIWVERSQTWGLTMMLFQCLAKSIHTLRPGGGHFRLSIPRASLIIMIWLRLYFNDLIYSSY